MASRSSYHLLLCGGYHVLDQSPCCLIFNKEDRIGYLKKNETLLFKFLLVNMGHILSFCVSVKKNNKAS